MGQTVSLEVLFERLLLALESLVLFLVIVGVVYGVGRLVVVPAVEAATGYADVEETLRLTILKVTGASFLLLGIYLAIPLSGLATTPAAIAAIGAGTTIALGFASRDVLANLVSGTFLVLDPRFHVGDWIQWNDREGIIEDISFRVTRVHTFDNELITVPNSELTNTAITNPVAKDRRRITVVVGIGYDDDVEHARSVLADIAAAHDEILDRPSARVLLEELGDSAVMLRTLFWIADPARAEVLRIRSEYVEAVKRRFEAEGIELPYPHQELSGTVGTFEAPGEER